MRRLKIMLTLGTALPVVMAGVAAQAQVEESKPLVLAQSETAAPTPEELKKLQEQEQQREPAAGSPAAEAQQQAQDAAEEKAAAAEAAAAEQQKQAEEAQRAKEAAMEQQRQAEEQRAQEQAAEQQRQVEEQQRAKDEAAAQQRQAEEAQAAEKQRAREQVQEQRRAKEQAAEEQRQAEQDKAAEQQRAKEQAIEQQRQAEEQKPAAEQQPATERQPAAAQRPERKADPAAGGEEALKRERQRREMERRAQEQQGGQTAPAAEAQPQPQQQEQAPAAEAQQPRRDRQQTQEAQPEQAPRQAERPRGDDGQRDGARRNGGDRNWDRTRDERGRDDRDNAARREGRDGRDWVSERGERMNREPRFDAPPDARRVEGGDDRIIFDLGSGEIVVRHDETRRLRHQAEDVYYDRLPDGLVRTTIERPDGVRIVTVEDQYGNVLERTRVLPDGREIVLVAPPRDYDHRRGHGRRWRDPAQDLPPITVTMPRDQYILEAERADRDAFVRTLEAPPVQKIEQTYSLEDVRYSERVRDIMPRIDLDSINFDTGSSQITQSEIDKLSDLAYAMEQMLNADSAETFLIEGHTDAVGSNNSNLALSDRRAESVASALTEVYDIPPENIVTQGYGEEYLKVKTDRAERENRRVTVRRITPLVNPVAQAQ